MTLEEQRAIEEEARNLGMTEAEDKVQALREEKAKEKVHPGIAAPVAGRDSGFGSEQDRHTLEAGQGKDSSLNSLSRDIWGNLAASRKRSHQWCVSLTPNNTKTIGRMKCFAWAF